MLEMEECEDGECELHHDVVCGLSQPWQSQGKAKPPGEVKPPHQRTSEELSLLEEVHNELSTE